MFAPFLLRDCILPMTIMMGHRSPLKTTINFLHTVGAAVPFYTAPSPAITSYMYTAEAYFVYQPTRTDKFYSRLVDSNYLTPKPVV